MQGVGSQSAMEFLSVYGWAFLVLAVFLLVISMFVTSKPAYTYLQSACSIQPLMPCVGSYLFTSGDHLVYSVMFTNNLGKPLRFPPNAVNVSLVSLFNQSRIVSLGNCTPEIAPYHSAVSCESTTGSMAIPPVGSILTVYFKLNYHICSNLTACSSVVYTTSGTSQTSLGGSSSALHTLKLYTNAAGSSIAVGGVQYQNGSVLLLSKGLYYVYAVPGNQSSWSSWSGVNITIADPTSQNTTITVTTNGSLSAGFT